MQVLGKAGEDILSDLPVSELRGAAAVPGESQGTL